MTAALLCAGMSSGVHQSLVVGSVVNGQTSIASVSSRSMPPLNDHTIFRIASLSKVFTATALAVSLELGEIDIDQAANDYLPDWLRLPDTSRPVTVRHLATHTSGLVAAPGAVSIHDAVTRLRPEYRPGSRYAYSNLGMSVLAWLIAARANMEFPTLLQQRVCAPLALVDTVIDLDAGQRERLALGVDEHGGLAATPTYPDYAGSGGLYGTVTDLLRFLQAQLGLVPHDLPLERTRRQWFDAGHGGVHGARMAPVASPPVG